MPKPKVEMLPGVRTNPRVMLLHMLEQADEIEDIALVFLTKDGKTDTYYTAMTNERMCWMRHFFAWDTDPLTERTKPKEES